MRLFPHNPRKGRGFSTGHNPVTPIGSIGGGRFLKPNNHPVSIAKQIGFTLIELLVVMAIIGILTALGVGNFRSVRAKARDAKKKSDLSQIAKAVEAYYNDHRQFPIGLWGKIICKQPNIPCDWGSEFSDDNGTIYSARLPKDSRADYYYVYIGAGPSFSMYAHLENDNDPSIIDLTGNLCSPNDDCNYRITSTNIQ